MYNISRLNQEEIDNMNRIKNTSSEIESIIKKVPTNKSIEPNSLIGEFYHTFTKKSYENTSPSQAISKN